MLPTSPSPGRALDIGCGTGELLRRLKDVGWRAEGIETNAVAARLAENVSGAAVTIGDFRECDLPREAFNLIVMNHVIEHCHNPVEALVRLHTLLVPGGKAVIVSPNPSSVGARVFREHWYPWEVPRHLVLLPPKVMSTLAVKAGFGFAKVFTTAYQTCAFFAVSRRLRHQTHVSLGDVKPGRLDVVLGKVEHALVGVGLPVGEEVVAVLKRTL